MKTVKSLVLLACRHDDDFTLRHKNTFCVIMLFRIIINNILFLIICILY